VDCAAVTFANTFADVEGCFVNAFKLAMDVDVMSTTEDAVSAVVDVVKGSVNDAGSARRAVDNMGVVDVACSASDDSEVMIFMGDAVIDADERGNSVDKVIVESDDIIGVCSVDSVVVDSAVHLRTVDHVDSFGDVVE
jgi:hypothetical protein